MQSIRVLPTEIINRIAAGEVVERPASILKELLENSIDAGATEISVELEEGGTKRLSVRDNGSGLHPDDLPLAFTSHATSKLDDDQLKNNLLGVSTMGFRGEALASIASIAMVTMTSRQPRAEHASRFRPQADGSGDAPEPAAGEPGTTVDVRNIFFNTPARRKFLRTTATELSHCLQQFTRVALAFPGIAFRLRHGAKTLVDFAPTKNLGGRLQQLVGEEVAADLLEITPPDRHLPSIQGFVGSPRLHRRDTKEQHFFVNGRWVRDRAFSHALRGAYEGFQIPGKHPVVYLFVDVEPAEVDVNVHPTKSEVRFRDSQAVYGLIRRAVRGALERSAHSDADREDAVGEVGGRAASGSGADEPASVQLQGFGSESERAPSPLRRDVEASSVGGSVARSSVSASAPATGPTAPPVPNATSVPAAFSVPAAPSAPSASSVSRSGAAPSDGRAADTSPAGERRSGVGSPVAGEQLDTRASTSAPTGQSASSVPPRPRRRPVQVLNSFILLEAGTGVLLIDQHALHEKVLFEEISQHLAAGVVESQRLLVPDVIDLSIDLVPRVERVASRLARFGFELEVFGERSAAVQAIPGLFDREAGSTDVREIVLAALEADEEHGGESDTEIPPEALQRHLRRLASTIACKRAVKAGMPLTDDEMRTLLDRGGEADDPRYCPHGRPTTVLLSHRDLDKLFDRK